jgi:hypothetical protein
MPLRQPFARQQPENVCGCKRRSWPGLAGSIQRHLLPRLRSRFGLSTSTANRTVGPFFREITGLWLFSSRRRARASAVKWPCRKKHATANTMMPISHTTGFPAASIVSTAISNLLSATAYDGKRRAARLLLYCSKDLLEHIGRARDRILPYLLLFLRDHFEQSVQGFVGNVSINIHRILAEQSAT